MIVAMLGAEGTYVTFYCVIEKCTVFGAWFKDLGTAKEKTLMLANSVLNAKKQSKEADEEEEAACDRLRKMWMEFHIDAKNGDAKEMFCTKCKKTHGFVAVAVASNGGISEEKECLIGNFVSEELLRKLHDDGILS